MSEALDAARWRALMASQRITAMGWAGFDAKPDGGYRHLTLNFWTHNEGGDTPDTHGREMLTKYVDTIIAAGSK